MLEVEGIILVLSCQKHLNTRLKEFKLPKDEYLNWKVIYVIGDLFVEKDYEIRNKNFLYIKCEDSYIHLLKKLVLSIKYLHNIYTIKQGILRCGDDLVFNETMLEQFLTSEKYDFYGKAYCAQNYTPHDLNLLKKTRIDPFMLQYYINHQEDFDNPQHNLKGIIISKYLKRPDVWGPAGIIYYLSNKACSVLIKHMEEINFNIWHLDEFTNSYPYTIEDCGVTYIMYFHKINFINNSNFFDTPNAIAIHTNKYK